MKIAVTSPSFSKHPNLIAEMETSFSDFKLNTNGKRFTESELIKYLTGYDAVIVGLDEINKKVIDALPQLKIVSKYGVGLNNIDLEYCKVKSIKIGWTGGVNKLSVAEMVIGNAISLLRNLYVSSNNLTKGHWIKNGGQQLSNKTVGIIGVGHIGKEVIRLLKSFECNILVNDIIDQENYYKSVGVKSVGKDDIFALSDIVTIHTPLTSETSGLIDVNTLSKMKKDAIIINTARGGIVNQHDLIYSLTKNKIGGASLDVYDCEPVTDQELLSIPNLINTPHIGGNSKEAVQAMGLSAISHIKNFMK